MVCLATDPEVSVPLRSPKLRSYSAVNQSASRAAPIRPMESGSRTPRQQSEPKCVLSCYQAHSLSVSSSSRPHRRPPSPSGSSIKPMSWPLHSHPCRHTCSLSNDPSSLIRMCTRMLKHGTSRRARRGEGGIKRRMTIGRLLVATSCSAADVEKGAPDNCRRSTSHPTAIIRHPGLLPSSRSQTIYPIKDRRQH